MLNSIQKKLFALKIASKDINNVFDYINELTKYGSITLNEINQLIDLIIEQKDISSATNIICRFAYLNIDIQRLEDMVFSSVDPYDIYTFVRYGQIENGLLKGLKYFLNKKDVFYVVSLTEDMKEKELKLVLNEVVDFLKKYKFKKNDLNIAGYISGFAMRLHEEMDDYYKPYIKELLKKVIISGQKEYINEVKYLIEDYKLSHLLCIA